MSILDEIPKHEVVLRLGDVSLIGQIAENDLNALEDENKQYITLDNPAEVHMQIGREGGINFAMIPFMLFREGSSVRINLDRVSAWVTPNDDMVKAYGANILGHKVAVPPEKKILLNG